MQLFIINMKIKDDKDKDAKLENYMKSESLFSNNEKCNHIKGKQHMVKKLNTQIISKESQINLGKKRKKFELEIKHYEQKMNNRSQNLEDSENISKIKLLDHEMKRDISKVEGNSTYKLENGTKKTYQTSEPNLLQNYNKSLEVISMMSGLGNSIDSFRLELDNKLKAIKTIMPTVKDATGIVDDNIHDLEYIEAQGRNLQNSIIDIMEFLEEFKKYIADQKLKQYVNNKKSENEC